VQDLPAVEGLARVDALCTDKTGTITDARVEWGQLIGAASTAEKEIRAPLAALAAAQPPNATLLAVRDDAAQSRGGDAPNCCRSVRNGNGGGRPWRGGAPGFWGRPK
jgi:cation-transporting ATPase E